MDWDNTVYAFVPYYQKSHSHPLSGTRAACSRGTTPLGDACRPLLTEANTPAWRITGHDPGRAYWGCDT